MLALRLIGLIWLALAAYIASAGAMTQPVRTLLFGAQAFTYYVDGNNGNDSNSGRSKLSAFKSLATVPTTLASGQSLCIVAGSVFQTQQLSFGVPTAKVGNIRIWGCGNGPAPIIDGSATISSGNWTKTGGLTVTYNTTSAVAGPNALLGTTGVSCCQINVLENGTFLSYQTSQANVDANAGSYTVDLMTGNTVTISVHASDGSNPASNGKTYTYTQMPWGLQVYCTSGVDIRNIVTRYNGANDGSLEIHGDGCAPYMQNVEADLGGKHNIIIPGGAVINGVVTKDAYMPTALGSGNMLVAFDQTGSSKPITINGGTFSQSVSTSGNSVSAILQHTASGNTGLFTVANSTITNTSTVNFSGIAAANVTSLAIDTLKCVGLSSCATPQTNFTVNKMTHQSSWSFNAALSIGTAGLTGTVSNSNFCSNNIQNGLVRYTTTGTLTLTLSNSVLYINTTQGGGTETAINNTSTGLIALTANGNIVDAGKSGSYAWLLSGSSTFAGDNNAYVLPNIAHWQLGSTTYTSLATWQAAVSPADANAVTTGSGASACN